MKRLPYLNDFREANPGGAGVATCENKMRLNLTDFFKMTLKMVIRV